MTVLKTGKKRSVEVLTSSQIYLNFINKSETDFLNFEFVINHQKKLNRRRGKQNIKAYLIGQNSNFNNNLQQNHSYLFHIIRVRGDFILFSKIITK